jgi:[acyl-carrier-protein] S-malonyltransferase
VPLVQNATAAEAADLATMLDHLKAHVYNPVYWTQTIETLRDTHGITTVIEAGPGKVLTGLGRRIDRSLPTLPIDSPTTLNAAIESINNATA